MNAPLRCAVYALSLAAGLGTLHAGGPVSVYALIDKVSFEPNAGRPDRVRISGVFITYERHAKAYSAPLRGYLYFSLPASDPELGRQEWSDLKSVAGTGQVVAFGAGWLRDARVRASDRDAGEPDKYTLNGGVQKLNAEQPRARELLDYKDK